MGVNTMIYAPMGLGGNVGIGFAVPSDTVDRIVTQIITHAIAFLQDNQSLLCL